MANIENPYETNLSNNLVVTSGIAELQNILKVRFARNDFANDSYGSAIAAISYDAYKEMFYYTDEMQPPTDIGEILETPENINILGITMDISSSYGQSLRIIVDEATANYMQQNNYNFVVYDKNNTANHFKFKSCYGNFAFYSTETTTSGVLMYKGDPLSFGEFYMNHHGNNSFFIPHQFCEDYIGKTVSFVIEKYETINSDLYLSEAYNDELLYSTYVADSPDNNGFYVDNLNIEYYPYKCATLFAYEDANNFNDYKINLGDNNTDYTEIFVWSVLFDMFPGGSVDIDMIKNAPVFFVDKDGLDIRGICTDAALITSEFEGFTSGIYLKLNTTGKIFYFNNTTEGTINYNIFGLLIFGGAIKFFHSGYGQENGILS